MQHNASCRSCGGSRLNEVISLGKTPLANALLNESQLSQPEPRWMLDLVRCLDCSLVQITETVPPESMFSDYAYFSSFSDTMVSHARTIAERLVDQRGLEASSQVIEIASNDGYLLQWYAKRNVPVLGIEPARNIAKVAIEQRAIPTISDFFGIKLALALAEQGLVADVIHANNVLAHVPDLNGVVEGLKALLKPGGRVVVEAPYLGDLIDHVEFDTIYHEHLCYFSLTALVALFARHGLDIVDVERLAIHGGSLRIFAAHASTESISSAVGSLLKNESTWVHCEEHHQRFASRVEDLRQSLIERLQDLKAAGNRIAVYGASAKGSTLMNYFGIDAKLIDYVVDRSTVKQGRYTPGTHLKIYDPQRLLDDQPDYCLLLTWNFAEEIMLQQASYRANGGKFIIPVPEVRVA
ncbi:class I SAM-dependent methyltransferase [Neorhodopirellula pilleata]|uniref:Ubiquinone biosynthesis O-methyltransferase n=1 Tax=Neorhodopirellula pilleata TaxID=2714738 RepID=A0A5C6A841_9BACT|nr:class I SAM-dependent methyltransferase [Neorhodopirellula pilleata]TWT95616.1 Ubiquinone biosynthesis O-methyltransferase [Neorhodopirellula pilleata]